MSNTPTVHPEAPPSPPYWRGCSDLTGQYGDFLYGTYLRSTNAYVRHGTGVAKRRGYERALDELFWGSAQLATHRDGEQKVAVVADGEGIKILSGVEPTTYSGFTIAHPGFPTDNFTRTNAASIVSSGFFWEEGKDSTETSGPTGADTFEIAANACQHYIADGLTADADWLIETPTPFWAMRQQIDLSAVTLGDGERWTQHHFIGLPPSYTTDPGNPTATTARERQVAADAYKTVNVGGGGTWTTWTGAWLKIEITRLGSNYNMNVSVGEFASDKRQSSLEARVGRFGYEKAASINNLTLAQLTTTWVFEWGRRQTPGGWKLQASVWRGETLTTVEATGNTPAATKELVGSAVQLDSQSPGGYYLNLPLSGAGGYYGISSRGPNNLSAGKWDIDELKPALTFVNPLD